MLLVSSSPPIASFKLPDNCFHLSLDQITHFAKLFRRHVFRIRNVPILTLLRAHQRALVTTAHSRDKVVLDLWNRRQGFRFVTGQVVADLAHCCDGLRIDLARWPRAGAVGSNPVAAMNTRKRFGHLAAIGILDTDEEDAFPSRVNSST